MPINEILATAVIASFWVWSNRSARLVRLAMHKNVSVLPLWVLEPRSYTALSLVNIVLLLLQYGLPIFVFFVFSWQSALIIIVLSVVAAIVVGAAVKIVTRSNPVLSYSVSASVAIVTSGLYLAFTV